MNLKLDPRCLLCAAVLGLALAVGGCGGSSPDTVPAQTSKPEAPKTPLVQKVEVAD